MLGGLEAAVLEVGLVQASMVKDDAVLALGCPSMGAEVLEETEMEPFMESYEAFAEGKTIALFGSYGWGDGEWMRDWVDRMKKAGAHVLGDEGLICQDTPDESILAKCRKMGEELAHKAVK